MANKLSINQERAKYINSRLTLGKPYTCNDKKINKVELEKGTAFLKFEDDTKVPVSFKDLKMLHQNTKIDIEL
ncbi:MAG: hypothetical protein HRU09_18245 [Oligoflexales bacterium]|nr:hypothetical protein [Oligoflexales bacterium]